MMRRLLPPLLLVTSLLCGCASTTTSDGAEETYAISVSGWSWGREYERWSINRAGSASHAEVPARSPVGADVAPIETALRITEAEFEEIAGLLDPLKSMLIDGVLCRTIFTDQDTYNVEWSRQTTAATLSVNFGCDAPSIELAKDVLSDAHERIQRLPRAAPKP